jgi:glycosyltransferase involved in cell wall biosynthesis
MSKLPISLVIIARDEAGAIARCLDSVPFAAEKLVVDSGSTDGTQQVATEHGARVIYQKWLGFGPQRNFATTQAQYDWILVLDADEALSPDLQTELAQQLPALFNSLCAGAVLRRQTWYMGAPMRWYRPMTGEKLGRIYHRQRARWTDARVHESLRFDGPVKTFTHPFVHLHNPSLVHKHLKTLLYAELKARDWQDKGRKAHPWMTPLVFIAAFLKDYFLRLAFLDGWRGYAAAHVAASYAAYKRLRFFEMTRNPESRAIAAHTMVKHGLERAPVEPDSDA